MRRTLIRARRTLLFLTGILTGLLLILIADRSDAASSTCYLYDGDAYWNCLAEERRDEQQQEELREQIQEDTSQAIKDAEEGE